MKIEFVNHVLSITLSGWFGLLIVAFVSGLLYFLWEVPSALGSIARELRRQRGQP